MRTFKLKSVFCLAGNYFRLVIAVSGSVDVNAGLHTIEGRPNANYYTLNVAGTLYMVKGQYISVWVYSNNDDYFWVQHESGFSAAFLGPANPWMPGKQAGSSSATDLIDKYLRYHTYKHTHTHTHTHTCTHTHTHTYTHSRMHTHKHLHTISLSLSLSLSLSPFAFSLILKLCLKLFRDLPGFLSDLSSSSRLYTNWRRIQNYRTRGTRGVYSTGGFNTGTGTFTAPTSGFYFVSALMRVDSAYGSKTQIAIILNGKTAAYHNGLNAFRINNRARIPYLTLQVIKSTNKRFPASIRNLRVLRTVK